MMRIAIALSTLSLLCVTLGLLARETGEGAFTYDDFEKPRKCAMCHKEISREWEQSMMSKCFTHEWDAIEYFKLALPQSEQVEKVAGVKAGCIGCHSPIAYLSGDIPPKPPAEDTRANEGVSCEVCHLITGSTEPEPFNFSYIVEPGKVKYGQRRDVKSSLHESAYSDFIRSPEFCACCHDEQSPYGAWVKSTYREWKQGPYAKEGTRCQDCHMYYAPGTSATKGEEHPDVAHHTFHGSHFAGKLAGAVDIALYAEKETVARGKELEITAQLFNGKAGHPVPTGSSEERVLWLEVTAVDAAGTVLRLPVDRKDFAGEEFTIADPAAKAYQAMGEIMGREGFAGVSRDGNVPAGSRIFRRPFFDPKGRMTICQWYTAENDKIDYRIGPRETRIETFTWPVPESAAAGPLEVKAVLYYSLVPSSVGEFMGLPASESAPFVVNTAGITVTVE